MDLLAASPDALAEVLGRIQETLKNKPGEYLVFAGATFAALLLAQARRWIAAALCFLCGVGWVSILPSLTEFIDSLGVDSFIEAQDFDWHEAKFLIGTLGEVVQPQFHLKRFSLYLVMAIAAFLVLRWLLGRTRLPRGGLRASVAAAVLLVAAGLHHTVFASVSLFLRNAQAFESTLQNFSARLPPAPLSARPLHVMVYIGESTSVMHMGLYGYPRDTTPRLAALAAADPSLLVFHRVFSTHTHTSQSLLEALSFAVDARENYLPIHARRRIALVELLAAGGIEPRLASNQGRKGTWNQASAVVFRGARQVFSTDGATERPWDHDFFAEQAPRQFAAGGGARLSFFHAYAGHGEYLNNIPPQFRAPVDTSLREGTARAVVGRAPLVGTASLAAIDAYDAAIRYVDHAVSEAIAVARSRSEPTVLVYFADHGESPYTGRGHHSARFVHEMARVPFLVYFNGGARQAYPQLYARYRALAESRRTATLAQVPATLLDLLGVRFAGNAPPPFVLTSVIGEPAAHAPIVVRETPEGIAYVSIDRGAAAPPSEYDAPFLDRSDDATRAFAAADGAAVEHCYERADTLGKALRGALVARCLMIDAGGPAAREIVELALRRRLGLWIRVGAANEERECGALARQLENRDLAGAQLLADFPAGSHGSAQAAECARRLRALGFAIAYRVPSQHATQCARALAKGGRMDAEASCRSLSRDVEQALASGWFGELSVQAPGVAALERVAAAAQLRWSVWDAKDERPVRARLRMVSLSNRDPNGL